MNILFDAGSLINLVNGRVIQQILDLPDVECFVGPLVLEECTSIRGELDAAIAKGSLTQLGDLDMSPNEFGDLLAQHNLGIGETECVAFLAVAAYQVSCDDRAARRTLSALYGVERVTGTLGLLVLAVQAGALTLDAAFGAYQLMRSAGGYLPNISAAEFEALAG